MTKTKIFNAFGVQYRVTQFPAVTCLAILGMPYDMSPVDALSRTEAQSIAGDWVRLDNRAAINKEVIDKANMLPPIIVLRGIMRLVHDFSFAFAKGWKGVKIPARLQSDSEIKNSQYITPMIAQILTEKMATLRELEEYYSLEDAFKMFDVIVAKSVNTALANESAGAKR
jgi:hypothetical protein